MKATREQVLAMAREAGLVETYDLNSPFAELLEALVHLAQQFTLDQIRLSTPIAGKFYHIPETLE